MESYHPSPRNGKCGDGIVPWQDTPRSPWSQGRHNRSPSADGQCPPLHLQRPGHLPHTPFHPSRRLCLGTSLLLLLWLPAHAGLGIPSSGGAWRRGPEDHRALQLVSLPRLDTTGGCVRETLASYRGRDRRQRLVSGGLMASGSGFP